MASILRHASVFARQVALSLCLFILLVSPFGLRTYLDASAAQRLAAHHAALEVDRPANVAAPTSASPGTWCANSG